jgi:hypothetical protein
MRSARQDAGTKSACDNAGALYNILCLTGRLSRTWQRPDFARGGQFGEDIVGLGYPTADACFK